jgi:DNA segregation ATPase FtsK/SpoIIIE-like protein
MAGRNTDDYEDDELEYVDEDDFIGYIEDDEFEEKPATRGGSSPAASPFTSLGSSTRSFGTPATRAGERPATPDSSSRYGIRPSGVTGSPPPESGKPSNPFQRMDAQARDLRSGGTSSAPPASRSAPGAPSSSGGYSPPTPGSAQRSPFGGPSGTSSGTSGSAYGPSPASGRPGAPGSAQPGRPTSQQSRTAMPAAGSEPAKKGGFGDVANRLKQVSPFGGGKGEPGQSDSRGAGGSPGASRTGYGASSAPSRGTPSQSTSSSAKSSGGVGGFMNRFRGQQGGQPATKSPYAPGSSPGKATTQGGAGGILASAKGLFQRDKPASGPAGAAAARPGARPGGAPSGAAYGSSASTATRPPGGASGQSAYGAARTGDPRAGAAGAGRASAPAQAAGGGFLGRINPFSRRTAAAATTAGVAAGASARQRQAVDHTPRMETEGLSLDNKLDIIGVFLVFGGGILILSALSGQQALISGLHNFLGQLLGWGAIAVPITLILVGGWLIKRHFGEEAPTVDPVRIAGLALGALALLTLFQYIDSLSYTNVTADSLRPYLTSEVLSNQANGGFVGAEIYYGLYQILGEVGGFVLVLFVMVVSLMLITRRSAAEMAQLSMSVGRTARSRLQQRAAVRRARELAARVAVTNQPQISVSQPAVPSLPAGVAGALPQGNAVPLEDRDILFRKGDLTFVTGQGAPSAAQSTQSGEGRPLARWLPGRRSASGAGTATAAATGGVVGGVLGMLGRPTPQAGAAETSPAAVPLKPEEGTDPVATPPTAVASASGTQASLPFEPPMAQAGGFATDAAQPQAPPASATPGPASRYGRPDDRIVHPSERLPAIPTGSPPPSVASAAARTTAPDTLPPAINPEQTVSGLVSTPPTNRTQVRRNWKVPDFTQLLAAGSEQSFDRKQLLARAKVIEDTLTSFGAPGRVVEVNTGPVITQFGVEPAYITAKSGRKSRVKVGAIAQLDKDLQLALGAKSIRVEAPVPGKGYVGIEVPNSEPSVVSLRDVMEANSFQRIQSPLAIALGQSVDGAPVAADLTAMPHLLIAGTTGSGKSVCVNSIIGSIIGRQTPDDVKFIMVDPKRVELTGYNGIPHLVSPVVVEMERIVGVLKWCTREMEERYRKFSESGSRNITDYNTHLRPGTEKMPYIVVIIDELADLMMLAPEETERAITRIAALARATGIHLVIATQRPSVDVVTGLIKANFPARIAFAVAGGVDSRVILDQPGAERLLGRGDMLYMSGNSPAPIRLQGTFVSDQEIDNLVRYWRVEAVDQPAPAFLNLAAPAAPAAHAAPEAAPTSAPSPHEQRQQDFWDSYASAASGEADALEPLSPHEDDLYEKAVDLIRRQKKASVSMLQRKLRIGYTRAARLIDIMEEQGVVGPAKEGSSKPRDVLIS